MRHVIASDRAKVCVFQSTHPRRVRLIAALKIRLVTFGFNPRTHVGCDRYSSPPVFFCVFQSTHPRRVRHNIDLCISANGQFQSTHPRRVRPKNWRMFSPNSEFQSTHPRRVRRGHTQKVVNTSLFQSTHPRRVRRLCPSLPTTLLSFNPRTHVGCDYVAMGSYSL